MGPQGKLENDAAASVHGNNDGNETRGDAGKDGLTVDAQLCPTVSGPSSGDFAPPLFLLLTVIELSGRNRDRVSGEVYLNLIPKGPGDARTVGELELLSGNLYLKWVVFAFQFKGRAGAFANSDVTIKLDKK